MQTNTRICSYQTIIPSAGNECGICFESFQDTAVVAHEGIHPAHLECALKAIRPLPIPACATCQRQISSVNGEPVIREKADLIKLLAQVLDDSDFQDLEAFLRNGFVSEEIRESGITFVLNSKKHAALGILLNSGPISLDFRRKIAMDGVRELNEKLVKDVLSIDSGKPFAERKDLFRPEEISNFVSEKERNSTFIWSVQHDIYELTSALYRSGTISQKYESSAIVNLVSENRAESLRIFLDEIHITQESIQTIFQLILENDLHGLIPIVLQKCTIDRTVLLDTFKVFLIKANKESIQAFLQYGNFSSEDRLEFVKLAIIQLDFDKIQIVLNDEKKQNSEEGISPSAQKKKDESLERFLDCCRNLLQKVLHSENSSTKFLEAITWALSNGELDLASKLLSDAASILNENAEALKRAALNADDLSFIQEIENIINITSQK